MMKSILLTLLLFLLLPLQAHGHKIHVFAWVSGNKVTVESGFSGNHPLVNGTVTVTDKSTEQVILTGQGDAKGVFTFDIPDEVRMRKADMLITVDGGEGHRSQWLVPATEYLAEQGNVPPVQSTTLNSPELEKVLESVLEKQLAPIRRSLARAEEQQPGVRDIIGGIGYLIGLAGLVSWLKYKK